MPNFIIGVGFLLESSAQQLKPKAQLSLSPQLSSKLSTKAQSGSGELNTNLALRGHPQAKGERSLFFCSFAIFDVSILGPSRLSASS